MEFGLTLLVSPGSLEPQAVRVFQGEFSCRMCTTSLHTILTTTKLTEVHCTMRLFTWEPVENILKLMHQWGS